MSKYCYKIIKRPEQLPDCQKEMDMQLVVSKKEDIHHSLELYSDEMSFFFEELSNKYSSNLILTGFSQEHIEAILPYIKDIAQSLYLFKCPRLVSFDFMAECKKLEFVEIYWNQKATSLWNVKNNSKLHTLIIDSCNKLSDFSHLMYSSIYHLEIWGCNCLSSFTPKIKIDDLSIFQTIPNLEVLRLAIMKNEDREKDLSDLSKLVRLKNFSIQNDYFSVEQITRLKAILLNTIFE